MSEGELKKRITAEYQLRGNPIATKCIGDFLSFKPVFEVLDEAAKEFPICKENNEKRIINRGLQAIDNITEYLTAIDNWKKKWFGAQK